MHVTTLAIAAAGLLETAVAFRCPVGQYGECYYFRGNTQDTSRCAIKCDYKAVYVQCNCPGYYPGQNTWKYTGRNDCITVNKFNGRNQCAHANPNGKRFIAGSEEALAARDDDEVSTAGQDDPEDLVAAAEAQEHIKSLQQ